MINSMTGFGRTELQTPSGQLQLEMRSVNHRYLDTQFKLPEGFRSIEQELKDLVSQRLKRGKVDTSLSVKWSTNALPEPTINEERAKQVIKQLETLSSLIKDPAPINPAAIIRIPGVVEEQEIDPTELFPFVKQALNDALTQLADNRTREGARIQEMLETRCAEILTLAEGVRQRLPAVITDIRKRLEQRIESLQAQVDNDRVEQELAIISQKLDVSEELDRLDAHVAEVRAAFATDEPVGRRLDFLMQELNREANTLGSKSADAEITQAAVDLKVLIEQMREQVQNVE